MWRSREMCGDAAVCFVTGAGLLCQQCGFGGGSVGPKFILVMDSQGKDDKTLQAEGNVSGRECSKEGCFQIGAAIPVYGVETFDTKKYNEESGLFDAE